MLLDVFTDRDVSSKITGSWEMAYPDPAWVIGEIHKAIAWENANPTRRKKDFGRFMTNWLNKGWDRRRIDAPRPQQTKGVRPSTDRTNDLDLEIFGESK